MIINFSVKNFRSIKDKVTLSFEATKDNYLANYYVEPSEGLRILKMAIIYGANASGKTNILKALDNLRKLVIIPFKTKNKEFPLVPFKFDTETPNQPTEFEIEFIHKGTRYLYFVSINRKAVLEERLYYYNPRKALIYSRITDEEKQLAKIKFGTKIKIPKVQHELLEGNTLWNNTVLGGFQKTNIQSEELKNVMEWFEEKFSNIIHPRLPVELITEDFLIKEQVAKQNLINLLHYADFAIDDIEIRKEEIEDEDFVELLKEIKAAKFNNIKKQENTFYAIRKIMAHKVDNRIYDLDFDDESDGTQRFFGLAGFLLNVLKNNKIMLIDELEASLHPDLIKHFLLTFLVNSKEAQLITTTHHRELLMEKDILRPDIIWFTERKQDQSTDLYSLADFDSSVIRKENSYYNFYKIGKLGAVPNLGSYYLNLDNGEEE